MATMTRRRVARYLAWAAALLAAFVLAAALALAMFPWGVLKNRIADRLSAQVGRPVTIDTMVRIDSFSLHPRVLLTGVRIPQPNWVRGSDGDLAAIGRAEVGFAALPLLIGRLSIETLDVSQARINLVRSADGRENWTDSREKKDGGERPAIRHLTIRDIRLSYRDAKQRRAFAADLAVDRNGLRLVGTGDIHGNPVSVRAFGAPIDANGVSKPWPFRAVVEGSAVGFTINGRMDRPLDAGHLTGAVTAHGDNLVLVDAIIEAGLPETQPVRLAASVRRDSPDWTITGLTGTIGHSDIAGDATVKKRAGRTRIDGAVRAVRFDFADLSSDDGKRKAAAKQARFGHRIVPDTAIDLTTVAKTDGQLDLAVKTLLWPGSSPFRSLSGKLTLDHSLLTLDPLTLGLTRGRLDGRIIVDQRNGGPVLTVTLALRSARMLDFFPDAMIDGALSGRIGLAGRGTTIRAAIGRATGTIGLAAQDGVIPARTASLLGQDVGRGLTTDKNEKAVLRCMIARLDVRNGIATANPVVIDTSRAQTRATGTINLADERMALLLNGAPKRQSILRLSGSVPVGGTISVPDIQVPAEAKSARGVLAMIGAAIDGKQAPTATDANCAALSSRALQ